MSTLKVDQIVDSSGLNNAKINGTYIKPGISSDSNRIINGTFSIWQRGTSHSTLEYGSVDRWRNSFSGGTSVISRQTFPVGTKLGFNSPMYFMRLTASGQTLSSDYSAVGHRIEGVETFSGETITVLGWARRNAGNGAIGVSMQQRFGTGGSPSSEVTGIGLQTVNLTTEWQPFSVVINVPSVTGKTLGTDGNDYAQILFYAAAGATVFPGLSTAATSVDFWGIHTRKGAHTVEACDTYIAPLVTKELTDCYRYYLRETNISGDTYPFEKGYFNTTTSCASFKRYPVPMRAYPTAAISNIAHFDIEPFDEEPSSMTFITNRSLLHSLVLFVSPTARTQGFVSALAMDVIGGWVEYDAEL